MDIQKEREAFEAYIKSIYPMGEQLAKDCGKTLCELYSSEWQAWQAAKAQSVHEQVLDAPACVGGGTFQKGVKWSTVIAAAQRHFKYTQNAKKAPSLDIDQVKKLVSGDFVLVPKDSLKVALSWMDEDIDPWQMGGDSFAELYEHKPILEALIEAQEQKG